MNPFTYSVPVVLHDTSVSPPVTRPFPSLNQVKKALHIAQSQKLGRLRSDPVTGAVGWRYKHYAVSLVKPTPEQTAEAAFQPNLFTGSTARPGRPGSPTWAHPVGEENTPEARQSFPSVAKLAAFLNRSIPGVYCALRDRVETREALSGELAARVGNYWIGLTEAPVL